MAAKTLAEVGAREQLLDIRRELPAIERIVDASEQIDLRSIRDEDQREQVRDIRALGKELRTVLRSVR